MPDELSLAVVGARFDNLRRKRSSAGGGQTASLPSRASGKPTPMEITHFLSAELQQALCGMTPDWQFSGKATFDARDAWCLVHQHETMPLAQCKLMIVRVRRRKAYRLTAYGSTVRRQIERNR